MPDLLFTRALLPSGWARDVLLSVDGAGTITSVRTGAAPAPSAESLEGAAVPGVPNVHSHAFQRGLAGLTERRGKGNGSFWTWRLRLYDFLATLGPDDVDAVASQLYVEMLRAGYTAVAEFHYLQHDVGGRPYADPAEMSLRLLSAAERSGIGLALLPAVYTAGGFGGAPPEDAQKRFLLDVERLLELLGRLEPVFTAAAAGRPFRRLGLALHSLRAVPPRELEAAVTAAGRLAGDTPVHVHLAETRREVEECHAWSGARPAEWLLDHAPVDGRWCLVHATHLSPDEVARVAATGAVVGLCPTTEANLGDGVFPLRAYLEAGGAFGVGSDSHVSVSPVEELRWLEYGQRLATGERNVAAGLPHASAGRSLLEGAWSGGARGLGAPAGGLEEGRRADIVVLDPQHPSLTGRGEDALLDSWIFAGNRSPVRHVLVGGRAVIRDGRHELEEEILGRYREVARRLGRALPA